MLLRSLVPRLPPCRVRGYYCTRLYISASIYLSFQEATNELVPLDLFGNYFFIFKTVMYDAVIVYMIKIYDRGKCSLLA